jgi:hypothetical protein
MNVALENRLILVSELSGDWLKMLRTCLTSKRPWYWIKVSWRWRQYLTTGDVHRAHQPLKVWVGGNLCALSGQQKVCILHDAVCSSAYRKRISRALLPLSRLDFGENEIRPTYAEVDGSFIRASGGNFP